MQCLYDEIKDYLNEEVKPAITGLAADANEEFATKQELADVSQGAVPNGSITAAKLADGVVGTAKIADGAVGTAKIARGAVTAEKMASALLSDLCTKAEATEMIVNMAAQCAFGTYVGTGTHGANHPNTLTFAFAPKFLVVAQHNGGYYIMALAGVSLPIYGTNSGGGYSNFSISFNGNTVSWYCGGDASNVPNQLNSSGVTYHYFAIGMGVTE